MVTAVVARFGGALRPSGTASRSLRTIAGNLSLASSRRVPASFLGGSCSSSSSKRCMSTLYAPSHEYMKTEGDTGTVGITSFAAKALGDVVFVDLPSVGDSFEAGDSFGSVESVKAASDVYAPANGEVVEINEVRSFTQHTKLTLRFLYYE
ncbi:unnamed protein product [Ascophyllum nodosum]